MAQVDVITQIEISQPAEKVSAYASNPDHAPRWYVNIKSVERLSPGPFVQGSKAAFKARFMGRELAYVYEVKEWLPGRKLVMATASGPFPMETTYEWEAISPDRSLMRLRNRGTPTGFSVLFSPLMKWMMRRANRKDLRKLKLLLEQSAH